MMIRFNNTASSTMNNDTTLTPPKKKYRKKPDPTAPKITRPCTECGKKFWSWKALFGHMRCHPERQWRGINPPSNRPHKEIASSSLPAASTRITEDDHDAALSLLMLANGFGSVKCSDQSTKITSENVVHVREGVMMSGSSGGGGDAQLLPGSSSGNSFRFECSSCKKVFGSHQALGGHRASHKNVKGCFANTRNIDGVFLEEELSYGLHNCDGGIVEVDDDNNDKMLMLGLGIQIQHHQCNVCFRVFQSGQALGGHKRCHWEKLEDGNINEDLRIDMNLPAPTAPRMFEGGASYCLHSLSSDALDLRLGL